MRPFALLLLALASGVARAVTVAIPATRPVDHPDTLPCRVLTVTINQASGAVAAGLGWR